MSYINFRPVKSDNHLVRIKEVFLQKNGKTGHVLEIKPFQKPTSEIFLWKDKNDITHVDGDMRGLSSDALVEFMDKHEYKSGNTQSL